MRMQSLLLTLLVALSGCAQYICYDGTYVEDPYSCYSHGGLSYFYKLKDTARAATLDGSWNINLTASSNSCTGISSRLSRRVSFSRRQNTMTATIPGTGRYAGRVNGKRVRFAGTTSQVCKVSYDVNTNFSSMTSGSISGKINANCFGFYTCAITFSGTMSRAS